MKLTDKKLAGAAIGIGCVIAVGYVTLLISFIYFLWKILARLAS